jgi:hypothetical protein
LNRLPTAFNGDHHQIVLTQPIELFQAGGFLWTCISAEKKKVEPPISQEPDLKEKETASGAYSVVDIQL